MNAEWTRLFKKLTHGLNTGIVVWKTAIRFGAEKWTSKRSSALLGK
jgi:hypothetical protein